MELEVSRKQGNQLPVEGRDEVYLTLQAKLWPFLGRHKVAGSTTPFSEMAAVAAQSARAAKKHPHSPDEKGSSKQARKKLPSIPLKKKVSTGGCQKTSSLQTRHCGIMGNPKVPEDYRTAM